MKKKNKIHVKTGDLVQIISGTYKGLSDWTHIVLNYNGLREGGKVGIYLDGV